MGGGEGGRDAAALGAGARSALVRTGCLALDIVAPLEFVHRTTEGFSEVTWQ
jgi:hypothetical protein